MDIRASLSHAYIAARRSERACKSPSSVYIEVAARLAPFLVSSFSGQAWVVDVFDWSLACVMSVISNQPLGGRCV